MAAWLVPRHRSADLFPQESSQGRQDLLLILNDGAVAHHHPTLPPHDHFLIRDDDLLVSDDSLLFFEGRAGHEPLLCDADADWNGTARSV